MPHPHEQRSAAPYDDGPLPDLTSGIMWLATAVAGLAVLPLPGSERSHVLWAVVLAGFAIAWGAASVAMGLGGTTMPLSTRALVTGATMPIVALALWATGGAASFLQPLLLFTALFIGYFFPPRHAWPLAGLFVAAYASPLVYDARARAEGYPARTATFVVAVVGSVIAIGYLKRRLVRAEARQREIAERDPLTGLSNRRTFDRELSRAAGDCALVLFDFDAFKAVNDTHGHPTGDAVLKSVAAACAAVVRGGDRLARVGGDEFALVAPGASDAGVVRIVSALSEAVAGAPMPAGVGPVRVTLAWAVSPRDGTDPAALFRCADQRLLERKRRNGARALQAAA